MGPEVRVARPRLDMSGLLWTLVRTDFKVRYHGTALGFLWALLKPLAMVMVLVFVFSFIFSAQPDYKFRLLVGLFLWEFFAQGTKVGLESLRTKGHLIAKTLLPRWLMVVISLSNPLLTLGVVLSAMLLAFHVGGLPCHPADLLLFGLYVLCLIALVLGISLATSVLYLRYRDLNQIWDMVIQAGFFFAPVVWPLGALPERYHPVLYLWPPTPIMEFSRSVLLGGRMPSLRAHLLLLGGSALILAAGAGLFWRMHARIAEDL